MTEGKPLLQNCRSFGNADNDGSNDYLLKNGFKTICYTNINNMYVELHQCLDKAIDIRSKKDKAHNIYLLGSLSSQFIEETEHTEKSIQSKAD